ncbi:MAG TPA: hypothetical protein VFT87_01730 [Candidatus Saccharimonadales bacterium]|nr:hypothetical protein [Candidatus Saccharimonadales bacterium]
MPRFVGTTEECFDDFVGKHPELPALNLLAEFSKAERGLAGVQSWQRGDFFPGGRQLLGIRCFLQLAGYDVRELLKLPKDLMTIALAIALGCAQPESVANDLGYKGEAAARVKGLWRVLLQGGGVAKGEEGKEKEVAKLARQYGKQIIRPLQGWQARIFAVLEAKQPQEQRVEVTYDPLMMEAFRSSVESTTAQARLLLEKGAAEAAREATHGGADILQLIEVSQALLEAN